MAKSNFFITGVAGILVLSAVVAAASVNGEYELSWFPVKMKSSPECGDGTIGECIGEEEFEVDTEINRRMLAMKRYISYDAMLKNRVPCSRRGASYYNCRPGAPANPYIRGCNVISRCRHG